MWVKAPNVFDLKYRDTRPTLRVHLREHDGQPHDLTGALNVALHIRLKGTSTVLSRDMTIVNATEGIVSYEWQETDWVPAQQNDPVLVLGVHDMEYEVTGLNDARGTFPNHEPHDKLSIFEDLGQDV